MKSDLISKTNSKTLIGQMQAKEAKTNEMEVEKL